MRFKENEKNKYVNIDQSYVFTLLFIAFQIWFSELIFYTENKYGPKSDRMCLIPLYGLTNIFKAIFRL